MCGCGLKQGPQRPLAIGNGVFVDPTPFKCGSGWHLVANPSADIRIERAFGLIQCVGHMACDSIDGGIIPHQGEWQGGIEPIFQSRQEFQGRDRIET